MTQHADILDASESMRGSFISAVALHAAIVAGFVISAILAGHHETFGAPNAGGAAVGVEAVDKIPLPHEGPKNPVANDTKSQVPQAPPKREHVKVVKPPPDAIPIKSRRAKKKPEKIASERQRFRPYDQLQENQLTTRSAPQVSTPDYSAQPGAGRVGTTINTTLGSRFAGYGAQIQQIVAQHWRTGDVDAQIKTAPAVIATFELMRDGSVRNLQLLQTSGITTLDLSVRRAIQDSSPLPPLPVGFDKSFAKVEFTFELKR